MEEKDKWIKNLRHRMEDYSEPAPADLWNQLEKELNSTPKIIPLWRRWQAVAAIALLVVISTVTVWFWHSPSAEYVERKSVEIASLSPSADMNEIIPTHPSVAHIAPEITSVKKKVNNVEVVMQKAVSAFYNEVMTEKTAEEKPMEETDKTDKKSKETEQVKSGEPVQKPAARTARRNNYYAYATPRKTKERKWSVGVSTGNVPFSSNMNYSGYGSLAPLNKEPKKNSPYASLEARNELNEPIYFANLNEDNNTKVEHHMPVTFGASLRFELNEKWGIETGVTYTLLSTDLRSGSQDSYFEEEQRLHYVGIPLKVDRRLWSNKRFEIYASAGGMVEKCVSGTMHKVGIVNKQDKDATDEKINVKPLQWSLSAAAGAQFKITEKVGIYAEPGVVYYFDDGSQWQTIRKEHPFNFNIQLGVRFTLK